jgi:ATP-dependent Lhr-like helicase
VAKKFGAVRKDADFKMLNVSKLIDVFEHSPIFEEAVSKTLWENMDVEGTAAVLKRIQDGTIELRAGKLSPMGEDALGDRRELIQPRRADRTVLLALRDRLASEDIVLVCMNCRSQRKTTVGALPNRIKCSKCGGVLVAAIQPYAKKDFEVLRKGASDEEGRRTLKRVYKNANLVMAHGKKAAMAMVGRGVGADTAARILARYHLEEDEFLRDILAAEVTYARTKRFWD